VSTEYKEGYSVRRGYLESFPRKHAGVKVYTGTGKRAGVKVFTKCKSGGEEVITLEALGRVDRMRREGDTEGFPCRAKMKAWV